MKKRITVILPIYKHSQQIVMLAKKYTESLKIIKKPFEVIFVINGEDEETFINCKKKVKDFKNIKLIYVKEKGWGNAIINGMQIANAEIICYTNSARTKVSDLITILKIAETNSDTVVKATRILRKDFLRKVGSILYNLECRLLLRVPVWDINGTPKAIPFSVIKKLNLTSTDDLIDAELMAKCIKLKIPVLEVPILFPTRYGGKSTTTFISALKMYWGVLRIKKLIKSKI